MTDILSAVRGLRERGRAVHADAGHATTTCCPSASQQLGIGKIDEDIEVLRELEILVDGDKRAQLPAADLPEGRGRPLQAIRRPGPFFYEIIQRKGDQGFGAGNFRALFESIEREQKAEGRI